MPLWIVRRKLLVFLYQFVDQYYQTEQWQGILTQANELGYNVLFFCGSVFKTPLRNDTQSNIIYNLPNTEKIEGFISMSGTLANYSGSEYFENFIKRYSDVPIVHLSYTMENAKTINLNNHKSITKLMDHIMTEHNYTKYTFLSGPNTNLESNERKRAFIDTMMANNVSETDYIIFEGDFSKESAIEILENMYKDNVFTPDIIICANDEMAIGTLTVLDKLNIETPGEVAFTGFDNISNAKSFTPSFTTVSQPIYEMGKASVKLVHNLITNTQDNKNLSFAGELIIRESCGCNRYRTHNSKSVTNSNNNNLSHIEVLKYIKKREVHRYLSLHHIYHGQEFEPIIIELLDTIIKELEFIIPTGSFMKLFVEYYKNKSSHFQLFNWSLFVQWLKNKLYKDGVAYLSEELHNMLYYSSLYTSELLLRNVSKENYDFMGMYYYSSELIMELTKASSIDEVFEIIVPYIRTYNFGDYYVCSFDEPIESSDVLNFIYPDRLTMSFGYENGEVIEPYSFESSTMLPTHLLESESTKHYIFYPLFFGSTHYGYHICTLDIPLKSIFRTIKEQIVNTLERLKTHKKLEEYNNQLKYISNHDSLTKILNRRGIYEEFERLENTHDISEIAIIYGDIDGLKIINDLYGHFEGDFAIVSIAKILKDAIADNGFVGRFGGDEFLCILKNPDELIYEETFINRVSELIKEHNLSEGKPYKLDISFGFSIYDISEGINPDDIFHESDVSLYKIKQKKIYDKNI